MGNQLAVALAGALGQELPQEQPASRPEYSGQPIPFEKLYKDGQVAVLYSPGFGAGWWSWNKGREGYEGLLFDADIAEAVLEDKHYKAAQIVESRYPLAYTSGVWNLSVKWVSVGAKFEITEYDGFENVRLLDEKEWLTA